MKRKTYYLLSSIDLDTQEKSPIALFSSKKELKAGLKGWQRDIGLDEGDLIEGEDYEINDFYIDNFYKI